MRKQRTGLVLGLSHGPSRDEIIVLGPDRDAEVIFRGIEARSPPSCCVPEVVAREPSHVSLARRPGTAVPRRTPHSELPERSQLFVRLQILHAPEVPLYQIPRMRHDEADSPDALGFKGPELYDDDPPEVFGNMQRERTFDLARGEGVSFGRNIRFRVLRIAEDRARVDLQFQDLRHRNPDDAPPYLILMGSKYYNATDEFAQAVHDFKEGQLVFWVTSDRRIRRGRVRGHRFLEKIGDCVTVVVGEIESTPLRSLLLPSGTAQSTWLAEGGKTIRVTPSQLKPTLEAVLQPATV